MSRFGAALKPGFALPALMFAALALSAAAGSPALAQQTAGDWREPLMWSDGKEVRWRSTPAAACDGSNVEIQFTNKSASSGTAVARNAIFACKRGAEFTGPQRDLGYVEAGTSVSATLPCACAEQGGVAELRNIDLDFMREGKGQETLTNGCTYTGDYSGGKRSGQGVYACRDGYRIEGSFRDDQPMGRIKETTPSGQTYEGDYINGKREGSGRLVYSNGLIYDGQFKNGLRDGVGTMIYPDGARYEGEWVRDQRSGQGAYIGAGNAWTYSGAWKDDQRNGPGRLSYADGSYAFEGVFANGKRQGQGEATFGDGRRFSGTFVDDKQVGPGTLTYPDGRTITGDFLDHRPNGHAVDTGPNATFDGQWTEGVLNGPVTIIGSDGVRFDGTYMQGKRNGKGVETFPDGSARECVWANDVIQGRCNKVTTKGKRIEYR
ncbi:MAG: hypothetical protein R3C52_11530 [Hyphomonadaceae bacterium]